MRPPCSKCSKGTATEGDTKDKELTLDLWMSLLGFDGPNLRSLVPTVFLRCVISHGTIFVLVLSMKNGVKVEWLDVCFLGHSVGGLFKIQDTLYQHSSRDTSFQSDLHSVGMSFVGVMRQMI